MPTKRLEEYSESDQRIMAVFGRNVRELREEVGLSQERLAEMTEVHRTYVSGIERGRQNISLLTMNRIARALSVSIQDLLVGL